jgi:lactoylglutathione lyase
MIDLTRDDLDVGTVAHDVEAMLHFYSEVLGLEKRGAMRVRGIGVLHSFSVGSNLVKVLVPEVATTAPPSGGLPWARAGVRYWTVHVNDLTGLLARLEAHGTPNLTGLVEPAPGIKYAIVTDPDGNAIEFVEGA